MKPEEIEKAAEEYLKGIHDEGEPRHVVDDFTAGAEWAIKHQKSDISELKSEIKGLSVARILTFKITRR